MVCEIGWRVEQNDFPCPMSSKRMIAPCKSHLFIVFFVKLKHYSQKSVMEYFMLRRLPWTAKKNRKE